MASPRHSLLLLTLALYTCTVLSDGPVALRISNDIHSASIRVNCHAGGENIVNPGSTHDWSVKDTSSDYVCIAFWTNTNKFVGWTAYEASRDAAHEIVYWVATEDGFYFGYDNTTWNKGVDWDSEIVY